MEKEGVKLMERKSNHLVLFYITNRPDVAIIAEKYGVDRIWIDLERLGKEEREFSSRNRVSNRSW